MAAGQQTTREAKVAKAPPHFIQLDLVPPSGERTHCANASTNSSAGTKARSTKNQDDSNSENA